MKKRKLTPKEQELAKEWSAMLEKHASIPKFTNRNRNHRTPPITRSEEKRIEARRAIKNEGLTIRSVPMKGNATVPFDASLEEAKRNLRGRAMPLFNKGGIQYATDGDLEDLQRGTNRRR